MNQLSDSELRLVSLLVTGATNKVIARHFNVCVRTVETWRARVMKKLDAKSPIHLGYVVAQLEAMGKLDLGTAAAQPSVGPHWSKSRQASKGDGGSGQTNVP